MRCLIFSMAWWCLALLAAGQAPPRLNVTDGIVYVSGLQHTSVQAFISEENWSNAFSVFTEEAFGKGLEQPVAGTYAITTDGFSFKPAYPFLSGAKYYAVFSPSAFALFVETDDVVMRQEHLADRDVDFSFQIPEEKFASTFVKAIYPASDVLPENLLRMHICFSSAMMPGEAYKHLSLIDERGQRVERPFLVVDQELWDESRTRLTILFDPGRIKRGLKANLDLGPPLREGERYSVMIDSTWRDAHGNALQRSIVKSFRVEEPVRTKLSIDQLTTITPPPATTTPLIIRFDHPMDRVLALKCTSVRDAVGNDIEGVLELDNDCILKFIPNVPWQSGNYYVLLSPLMEDVGGNNFKNAFDLDMSKDSRIAADEIITLPVSIVPLGMRNEE